MGQNNLKIVTEHTCLLGEGPVWDNGGERIFWVDILNENIHYFYPGSGEHKIFNAGAMVGAVALRRSGGLIAALEDGFATIDLNTGIVAFVTKAETHLPGNRFNDGKCDPAGRFWAGSMSISDVPYAGSLYALEKNFTLNTKIAGVSCSNGLAWSPDQKTVYYIDTPTRNIVAYDYEMASGNIDNGRTIISIPEPEGYPDGMTIDTDGMLWIALWGGWKVIRCDPHTGKRLSAIHLPVSRVSSCVFGGDAMEDLYITSARTGLSEYDLIRQPLSGTLFVIPNCGYKGMEAFEFDG